MAEESESTVGAQLDLDFPFAFGASFLRDHAGQIITDPRIALIEMVANGYDAGATQVSIRWPSSVGDPWSLEDNGTGMTPAEFRADGKRSPIIGARSRVSLLSSHQAPRRENGWHSEGAAKVGMPVSAFPTNTKLKPGKPASASSSASS